MKEPDETTMMNELSEVLGDAQLGTQEAESEIHQQFVSRLVNLASQNINRRFRSKIDPEDVVQSVFASFFRRHRKGEFDCEDWNDLWVLLVKITLNKCINKVNSFRTIKRDVSREVDASNSSVASVSIFGASSEPTAQEVVIFNESLDRLFDQIPDELQQIVCMRLQGMTNYEISEELQCSSRTVYRALNRIRKILKELDNN